MANSTLANLKIGALKRVHHYSASDTELLSLAGGLINDALGLMFPYFKKTPYVYDIGNTVDTVASQAYIALADTDILEILNVYQATSNTNLKRISWDEYVALVPDSSEVVGTPESAYAVTQSLDGSGQNIFSLYFAPTPSSAIEITYDYMKNIRFATDDSDSDFCILPNIYDAWIYAEFRVLFFQLLYPKNSSMIRIAENARNEIRVEMGINLREVGMGNPQMGMYQGGATRRWDVQETSSP